MRKKITKKEKREVGIILGAVLLVALVGISLNFMQVNRLEAVAGAAVRLDPNIPTYPGTLVWLRDYCEPTSGTGTCTNICAEKVCVPIEANCNQDIGNKNCLCCNLPE